MLGDERTEFAAGVAAGAEDADRDSMHIQCILLHGPGVNRWTSGYPAPPRRRWRAYTRWSRVLSSGSAAADHLGASA